MAAGGMLLAANEKSASCSAPYWCAPPPPIFVSSFCLLRRVSVSCLFPSFLLCSFFLSLSLVLHAHSASCSLCLIWAFLSPRADKTTLDLSELQPPECTHSLSLSLPFANHTQEMGSHANEACLASGAQDGVSGLEMFLH